MNYWIFQAKPDRFDMSRSGSLRPGSRDSWLATRYRTEMKPGDIVYLWQSGNEESRGIYGWGHITSEPYERGGSYEVDVQYGGRLQEHIRSAMLERDRHLSDLLILRLAIGTNFLLDPKQGRAIARLMPTDNRPEVNDA